MGGAEGKGRKSSGSKKDADSGQKSITLTGCLDERGERYVLAGERQMHKEATLHGKSFTDDNFARYLGHTVRITGEAAGSGDSEVINVTRIEDVKANCR